MEGLDSILDSNVSRSNFKQDSQHASTKGEASTCEPSPEHVPLEISREGTAMISNPKLHQRRVEK